jgi:hypothetical protein
MSNYDSAKAECCYGSLPQAGIAVALSHEVKIEKKAGVTCVIH